LFSILVYENRERTGYPGCVTRRSAPAIEAEAKDALIAALASLHVPGAVHLAETGASDFIVSVGGTVIAGEVKSVVTEGEADRLAREFRRRELPTIVVADRIAEGAKSIFRKAGVNFLDRRGELRIVVPPLIVDARIARSTAIHSGASGPLSSQVAQEVAIACLLTPDQVHGVREVATYVDRAPSAVSNAMAGLRKAGFLTSKGEAAVPDLFNELSIRWRREPFALAALPGSGRGSASDQLELGLERVEATSGWALSDTVGAAAWGMPVVARGDYPPDFYVPTDAVLRRARALLGDASDVGGRACSVAVAPVRLACLRRHQREGEKWPVANHIVVSLDIAGDRARGSEVLDQWHPEGIVRAW
jgi:hypothetical protein